MSMYFSLFGIENSGDVERKSRILGNYISKRSLQQVSGGIRIQTWSHIKAVGNGRIERITTEIFNTIEGGMVWKL